MWTGSQQVVRACTDVIATPMSATWLKVWSGTEAHLWHMKFCSILGTPFRAQHFVILCTLAEMWEFQPSPMVSWSTICSWSVIFCVMMWLRLSRNDVQKFFCSLILHVSVLSSGISSNLKPTNLSKTSPNLSRGPAAMGWRYSRVTIAPGINDRDLVQERFLTKLPDQWLGIDGRLELGMVFSNKKDRIDELELSKLWWNWNVLDCHLFVAQDFCSKDSRGFAAAHRGMDTQYWCHHVPTRLLQVWANQTLGVVYLKYVALILCYVMLCYVIWMSIMLCYVIGI